MAKTSGSAGRHVGYEYQEQTVGAELMPLYTDNYGYFGWELEGRSKPLAGVNRYVLKFKRDRKIIGKMELTRLQRHFDSIVREIESMENSKIITASMIAYAIGVIGTALMAAAVFAYLAGSLPLFIVLAIPGFIGWVAPYLSYQAIQTKKAAEVQPFIEQKYEELYTVCERAHTLMN